MQVLFEGGDFVPTRHETAAAKAEFARHLVRFLEAGCPFSMFSRRFYNRLKNTFGHIAHHDRQGFYCEWFSTHKLRYAFLEHLLAWPCYGDSSFTFSDVERAIQIYLRGSTLIERYRLAANTMDETFSPYGAQPKDAPLAHVTVDEPDLFSQAA